MKKRNYRVIIIIFINFILLINLIKIVRADFTIDDEISDTDYFQWYKITYNSGEQLSINVSSSEIGDSTLAAIISNVVQPETNLGGTSVLAGDIINKTQNASIKYSNSNNFQLATGLYLLLVLFNESITGNISYRINTSHQLTEYNYERFFQESYMPMLLLVAGIVIAVAATITVILIRKWYKGGKKKII
ncbi:MAG: hypothetical protein GF329_06075 [Candidatus Lokiarchaeota archaeon]|nr:hypothetical protein [Candidatus Lokiarchaeota archaeon]